jgi:hypothetical protein
MAATKISDPITAQNYSSAIDDGVSGSITQLWHSDAADHEAKITEILTANTLVIGYSFPTGPRKGAVVNDLTLRLISESDPNVFQLDINYGKARRKNATTINDWVFNSSSSLSMAQTNIDINDDFITVGTVVGSPLAPAVPTATTVPKTGASVERMFPSTRITTSARVSSVGYSPHNDIFPLVGTINNDSFYVDGFYVGEYHMMLVGADITPEGDGEHYNIDYTFEYRTNILDWYAVVVAIDPKTGKPYEGIAGTRYKTVTTDTIKGTITITDGSIGYRIYKYENFVDSLFNW